MTKKSSPKRDKRTGQFVSSRSERTTAKLSKAKSSKSKGPTINRVNVPKVRDPAKYFKDNLQAALDWTKSIAKRQGVSDKDASLNVHPRVLELLDADKPKKAKVSSTRKKKAPVKKENHTDGE